MCMPALCQVNENDEFLTALHKKLIDQANKQNKENRRIEMKKRLEEEKKKNKIQRMINKMRQQCRNLPNSKDIIK